MADIKVSKLEVLELILLVVVSIVIFFWKLDKTPGGFYIDEALPGYSAYSILKTGHDEWGKAFPILFRFYGSFNPPLYIYFTVIPEYFFGPTVFAVRFISAVSAIVMVLATYFIFKRLSIFKGKTTAFFGALLFAISPWLVLYGRTGYEVTPGLLFFVLGVYAVYLSLKKPKLFVLGMVSLAISINFAYTERFLGPLFLLIFFLVFNRQLDLKTNLKTYLVGFAVFIIIMLPYLSLLGKDAFFPKSDLFYNDIIISQSAKISRYLPGGISYPLSFIREFLSRYLSYFSPRSLFFLPDPDPQRSIPELSVFYFWMIAPYLLGLYDLVKRRHERDAKLIIILLIISPIAASLTRDPFSTHRAFPLVFPLVTIIGLGIDRWTSVFRGRYWGFILVFLILLSGILLWRSYFILLPKERAKIWGFGVKELVEQTKEHPDKKFVVDQSRTKPTYASLAFFMRFPPEEFQKEIPKSILDNYYASKPFSGEFVLENVITRNIDWKKDVYEDQILVGDEYAVSSGQAKEHFLTKVFEIRDPIDQIVFQGFQTNPRLKCKVSYIDLYCRKYK